MGPKAEALLAPRSRPDDLVQSRTAVRDDAGDRRRPRARPRRAHELRRRARLRALRADGPVRHALRRARRRQAPNSAFSDAGYYTIDALRIEAGRRAWGAELSPDETPWEAGLAFAVKMDKTAPFIGRDALASPGARAACASDSCSSRSTTLPHFHGAASPILMDGERVGEITSAGFSRRFGRALAMGYARADRTADRRSPSWGTLPGRPRRRSRRGHAAS